MVNRLVRDRVTLEYLSPVRCVASEIFNDMKARTGHTLHASPSPVRTEPMGDHRFRELMADAGAFFANAERDVDAERAAAIAYIRARMVDHGLTTGDLSD